MNDKLANPDLDRMFKAILSLETLEECYNFFEDLCTITEIKAFEQRFTVALMLSKHMHYGEIVKRTGASSATVSRVNRSLMYGKDGYKLALERLDEE